MNTTAIKVGVAALVAAAGVATAGATVGSTSGNPPANLTADYTGYCGVEFNAIKDLKDGFVPGNPIDSTIGALAALKVDSNLNSSNPTRSPIEHNVYRIEATLIGTKGEADSDIHMLLRDPVSGATMGTEIPAAPCLAGSTDAPLIEQARAALIANYGVPPTNTYSTLNACVDVTGVAFFDIKHGQADVAPNGIELHPVLSVLPCGQSAPPPPVTTGTQPVDIGPVTTTAPVITATTTTITTYHYSSCEKYPGRHYYYGRYHKYCRYYYYTTP